MPVIGVNGESIHYVKDGTGPAVALIHSLGASVHMWRGTIAALKDRYTVIAFDMRGHGGSSAKGECSVAAAAQDLKAVLDGNDVAECHVVGISSGGPVALTFAVESPNAVKSLLLANSFARPIEGSKERVEATAEAIAYISMEEFGTQYAAETLLPSTPLDVQDELAAAVTKVNPKVYIQLMRSALLGEFAPLLARVTAPTLVLAGAADTIVPRSESEFLAGALQNAEFDVIPSAGHLACLDNPHAFNEAVMRFLEARR